MSKALCIVKSDLVDEETLKDRLDIFDLPSRDLFKLQTKLLNRPDCETDLTHLQLIPYITLFDKNTQKIFIYQRGKASGESRLTGKCSIGLGGHVEVEPVTGAELQLALAEEAARELQEEVGITDVELFTQRFLKKLRGDDFGLIHHNGTDVDKVHLGISMLIGVDPSDLNAHEENVITRSRWMSFEEIQEAAANNEIEIEHWTRMVLQMIEAYFNKEGVSKNLNEAVIA